MDELLKKLAILADQLDQIEAVEIADEVDTLMRDLKQEIGRREKEEDSNINACPTCGGSGVGVDSPWCEDCKGTGFAK